MVPTARGDAANRLLAALPAKDRKAVRESVQLLADAANRVLAKDKQRR